MPMYLSLQQALIKLWTKVLQHVAQSDEQWNWLLEKDRVTGNWEGFECLGEKEKKEPTYPCAYTETGEEGDHLPPAYNGQHAIELHAELLWQLPWQFFSLKPTSVMYQHIFRKTITKAGVWQESLQYLEHFLHSCFRGSIALNFQI